MEAYDGKWFGNITSISLIAPFTGWMHTGTGQNLRSLSEMSTHAAMVFAMWDGTEDLITETLKVRLLRTKGAELVDQTGSWVLLVTQLSKQMDERDLSKATERPILI